MNNKNDLYFDILITSTIRQINAVKNILTKAETWAKEKGLTEEEVLNYKLADDMLPLVAQVRILLDNAKMGALRAAGKENIPHEDNETAFAQLQTRADDVIRILGTVKSEDFDGIEGRTVEFKWMPGVVLNAEKTITNFTIPNFYFHVTTMYDILRNKGLNIGKMDFINWDFK